MQSASAETRRIRALPHGSSYRAENWDILSRHWYPVAQADQLGDAPVAVTLLDVPLVLFRAAGEVVILHDHCPHRGVPLSRGAVVRDELVCPYHGLSFAADGRCTRIPAQPDLTPSARLSATTFPSVQHVGLIWTCLAPDGPPVLPPLAEWDEPGYEKILPPHVDISGSPARQVEGFIDVAHFAFVHDKAFADPENAVVPSYETELTDFGLRSNYVSDISNYPKALQHLAPPDFRWLRAFEVYTPFCAKLTVHFPGTQRYHILNAASPVSARKTRLFVPIARNFDTLGDVASVLRFNAQIFAEDAAIVELQRPVVLDAQTSDEEHFAADRSSVAYRRALRRMGLSEA
jgi:vanillate O-demethylase monooxygenase subunit